MKEFVYSQHVWYRIIKWWSITPCPPNNGNAQCPPNNGNAQLAGKQ